EVDRLSEFGVADQRSTVDIPSARIFPVRELLPTAEVQTRARELLQQESWGREQWDRLAEGATFDGMESWLPWLSTSERTLIDVLPEKAQLLLAEPKRMRDRAEEICLEEADLARSLS